MKLTKAIGKIFQNIVAPTNYKCVNCGRDVFDDTGFCPDCAKLLPFNNGKTCARCGVGLDGEENYCGNCSFDKVYFDKAYSVFDYDGIVKDAILKMKFANLGSYAKVFAYYLVWLAKREKLSFDVVTFAPMSKLSYKRRKYNQAQLLANAFCDLLDIDPPVATLVKHKETQPQEQLNKTDRKKNLVGAYKLNSDVKGKRILLIDDVKTTGATINQCAQVLKRGGATTVVALTVASRREKFTFELQEETQ